MKKIIIMLLIVLLGGYLFMNYKNDTTSPKHITINFDTSNSADIPKENEASKYNLIELSSLSANLIFDLRYASKNNFAGEQFYPKIAKAYLIESTAKKLESANEEFYKLGYRIKIYDAYRPRRYQYLLRECAANINPTTQGYIASPETGSHHNRGVSVDITLTDLEGRELDMPTKFDFFGPEASIYYNGCTAEQKKNRELLGTIMEKHGFRRIESEWWHFDDINYLDYPLLDIDFIEIN